MASRGGARGPAPMAFGLGVACLVLFGVVLALGSGANAPAGAVATPAAAGHRAASAYGRLPLRFEANRGQTDSRVDFLARGAGYTLFLTPREAVVSLSMAAAGERETTSASVRIKMVGSNPDPKPVAVSQLPGVSNYLTGKDRGDWRAGVPGYRKVRYENVYPGTDVVYYGRQGKLEYDFVLAPGADPKRIVSDFTGARGLRLDRRGDLLVDTRAGTIRQQRPSLYQRVGGAKRKVAGRYVVRGRDRVGFQVGVYDRGRPLVIDPVLSYSTFLGGERVDHGQGIAVDPACSSNCSAYVTGATASLAFPTRNPLQGSKGETSAPDAFVTKLDPTGTALEYSTYLGGSSSDAGQDIAVDAGRAYVAGNTFGGTAGSGEFPTTAGAYKSTCGGCAPNSNGEAFLAVLEPGGTLKYSTFIGGASSEQGTGVAARDGKAYLTGTTNSDSFPTSGGAYDRVCGTAAGPCAGDPGRRDAFVAKFDPAVSGNGSLVYSTFLGGSASEPSQQHNIAVDSSGKAHVAGQTLSDDFPVTPGSLQTARNGAAADAFATKLNPTGTALEYSTYLGGSGSDFASSIDLDSSGSAYLAGATSSTDFPVSTGAYQGTNKGSQDAFVAKLNPAGTAPLQYSTYLGSSGFDSTGDVEAEGGRAYVALTIGSADFADKEPVTARERPGGSTGFVTAVAANGSEVAYSTPLSGSDGGEAVPAGVAVDPAEGAYIVGNVGGGTGFSEFPTTAGAFQPAFAGGTYDGGDAFVAKLTPVSPLAPYVTGVSPPGGPNIGGTSVTITGTGFTGASAVSFGSVPAQSFQVESDGRITAVRPRHAGGQAPVTVTTPTGSSPANPITRFTYGEGLFRSTMASGLTSGRLVALREGRALHLTDSAAKLYDPKAEAWTPTGAPQFDHGDSETATLLRDGRVLVLGSGGAPAQAAELYDPATGSWRATANPPAVARQAHTAVLLWGPACEAGSAPAYCGKVLVAGGSTARTAELYDPRTDRWSNAGPLATARRTHTATLLAGTRCTGASPPAWCGKVLVAGGHDPGEGRLESAELYDPKTNTWSEAEPLPLGRDLHMAVGLLNGKVLIPGIGAVPPATPNPVASQLYDPDADRWTLAPVSPHPLREYGTSTPLPNGKALFFVGARDYADLFDPKLRGGAGDWVLAGRRTFSPSPTAPAAVLSGDPIRDDFDPGVVGSSPAACGADCGKVLDIAGQLYTPAPSVRSISPSGGPGAGGTAVTITGTGFTHDLRSVTFGGAPAQSFRVDSYSRITAVAPSHADGLVDVVVANEGGEEAGRFAYRAGAGPGPSTIPGLSTPGPLATFADCPSLTANVIRGTAASNSIVGTPRADRIFGGTGDDSVEGLAGNDCIDLGPGADRGQGGSGADLLVGGLGRDRLAGGSGTDRLRGGSSGDRLFGGSGNDVTAGGSGNDVVSGDRGNDRITGNSGNDVLKGSSGKDRIAGGTGRDRISGGSGNDRISSRDGRRDRVDCGRGRDVLVADRFDRVARNCERVRRGRARTSTVK